MLGSAGLSRTPQLLVPEAEGGWNSPKDLPTGVTDPNTILDWTFWGQEQDANVINASQVLKIFEIANDVIPECQEQKV